MFDLYVFGNILLLSIVLAIFYKVHCLVFKTLTRRKNRRKAMIEAAKDFYFFWFFSEKESVKRLDYREVVKLHQLNQKSNAKSSEEIASHYAGIFKLLSRSGLIEPRFDEEHDVVFFYRANTNPIDYPLTIH